MLKIKKRINKKSAGASNNFSLSRIYSSSDDRAGIPDDPITLVRWFKSWVYKCVKINADSAAQCYLRLYAEGGTQRWKKQSLNFYAKKNMVINRIKSLTDTEEISDPEHPLLKLLNYPNTDSGGFDNNLYNLIYITTIYLELIGNCFWYIEMDALGVPVKIRVLLSQYISYVYDKQTGILLGYEYGTGLNKRTFGVDELVHFSYPNPQNYYEGMSPLQAALECVDRNDTQTKYERRFYANNQRPDFAVTVEGNLSEEKVKELRAQWKSVYGGKDKSFIPAFLEGGMKVANLSFSPRESNAILDKKYSRDEIIAMFGVPLSKIEIVKGRAEAEENNNDYLKTTILPILKRMSDIINTQLCPLFDAKLFIAFDNPVPKDTQLRITERESNLRNGFTTINEEREEDGYDPVAWGDVPLLPANVMPLGSVPVVPYPAEPQLPESAPMKNIKHVHNCKQATDMPLNFAEIPLTKLEKDLFAKLKEGLGKQYQFVLAGLATPEFITQYNEALSKYNKFKSLDKKDQTDNLIGLFSLGIANALLQDDKEDWEKVLLLLLGSEIDKMSSAQRLAAYKQAGVAPANAVLTDATEIAWRDAFAKNLARQLTETARTKLQEHISVGLKNGLSANEVIDNLKAFFDMDVLITRIQLIARDISFNLRRAAQAMFGFETGVDAYVWRLDPTLDNCAICIDMEGVIVKTQPNITKSFSEYFSEIMNKSLYPGFVHPFCGCSAVWCKVNSNFEITAGGGTPSTF